MQAIAEVGTARAGRLPAAQTGHDVHALRGAALRQSDVIADLRSCMSTTEVKALPYAKSGVHTGSNGCSQDLLCLQYLDIITAPRSSSP